MAVMDYFCGSTFWNWNETWNTSDPDFTPCFEDTVLVAIPCLFLWISSIFEIYKYSVSISMKIPWTWLNISKIIVVVALILAEIGSGAHQVISDKSESSAVYYYSAIVKISSLILSLCLHIAQRHNGCYISGVQFIFWLLLSLYEAISIRTVSRTSESPFQISLNAICSGLVFLQLLLNFFSDSGCKIVYSHHSPIEDDSKDFPEHKASWPSQLTFFWVDKLLWKGFKTPIKLPDLWALNKCNRAEYLILEFEKHSKRNVANPAQTSMYRNIIKPLFILFRAPFLWSTLYCTSMTLLSFALPEMLSLLIDFVEDKNTIFVWRGYFYATLLGVASLVKTLLSNRNFYLKLKISVFVKSVLSCAVYRKALKVSNAARKDKTTGEIVNLLSVDVQKVQNIIVWLNEYWDSPIQICIAVYLLYCQLGVAIFVGITVLLLLIPINLIVTKLMHSYQTSQMKKKDERIKLMNEILSGIKILKLYAWEPSFEEKVKGIRETEISILKKQAIMSSIVEFVWTCTPVLVALTTFITYVLLGHHLDAKKTFVSLALFNLLNEPITFFPTVITKTVEVVVSLQRLNEFMNAEEIDPTDIEHSTEENGAIVVENASFAWDIENPTLENINLNIKNGSLVAVVGMVGCGKSSLLSALLGEMKKLHGRVNIIGQIAYVSQQPWIQNNTLQDNIYFGQKCDSHKYDKVLESCALLPDLEILPGGDQTEIGEKGINLSGGQKQRVALARAAYSNADIFLFDDPLSAVDAHVGKHIFEKLLGPTGMLKRKTRILVTHGLTYLPKVDQIIVLKEGKITEYGTYTELLNKKGAFSEFLITYLNQNNIDQEDLGVILEDLENVCGKNSFTKDRKISETDEKSSEANLNEQTFKIPKSNIIEEERPEVGNIKWSVLFTYMKSVGWIASMVILFMLTLYQVLAVGSNVWLSVWTSSGNSTAPENPSSRDKYLSIYGILGFGQCLTYLAMALILNMSTLQAAKFIHNGMLSRILKAPMSFFDTTPIGRIINRFSSDVQTVDTDLPYNWLGALDSVFKTLAILVVISWSTPLFLIVMTIISAVFVWIQRYYLTTARQLFRVDSITRSPVFSHFTETLHGVSTIRAYSAQERFLDESSTKIDTSISTTLHLMVCRRWLSVRLELLGCVVIFSSALFSVIGRESINASIVGLSVSYALQISQLLSWVVMITSLVETNMVSVERICEYTETVQEAKWDSDAGRAKKTWPEKGVIEFHDYETRYRENLEPVLNKISCTIEDGEKIGIVGRTGAGKSSMTLALFRIIEATCGEIIIDGLNIFDLGLHDIRGRITIIPQDPVLFSGSIRFNLDPFSKYEDDNIWKALELAHLKTFVLTLSEGLCYEITEEGGNLSVGQRQLVCLARAILRKSRILILDEATASIDLETDDLIQETIRKEFSDCTILTIAHRINTIMDSNRVIVLDKGEIAEFDVPENLLSNKSSLFYQLAKDAGLVCD